MTERLLQFIWQFQYFDKKELATTQGETVQVLVAGRHNENQGPDFSDAKIRIGPATWAGTAELHISSSDWLKHKHQHDKNYNNVVLHVVWEDDGTETDIPVLELKGSVSKIMLERYEELMLTDSFIPCEKAISAVKVITWKSWKDRLLAERLNRKASTIETCLRENNFHWEETCWWLLARNFGSIVNSEAFEAIAKSLPLKILSKHKSLVQQLEALFLGQAGLLEQPFKEEYPKMLQREYRFLKEKYQLQPIHQPVHFLRMRPGNFPTIRLAQLAMLVSGSVHLFSKIKETLSLEDITGWLDCTANDYWHYHYRLDEESAFKIKHMGSSMINNIMINTVVPLLFAYGNYHQENKYKLKALNWLEATGAETNKITSGFGHLGIENKNAFDSQALIELKNEYCDKKRCLECSVGNSILTGTETKV